MTWAEFLKSNPGGSYPDYMSAVKTSGVRAGDSDTKGWALANLAEKYLPGDYSGSKASTGLGITAFTPDNYMASPEYLQAAGISSQYKNNPDFTKYLDSLSQTELENIGSNIGSTQNQGMWDGLKPLEKWQAGLGVAQFGLGLANYFDNKKYMDKQMEGLDQQLAMNKRSADNKANMMVAFKGGKKKELESIG